MADVVAFVLGSDARREVVARLADDPASGRTVVRESEASESSVYDALSRLSDRGLVVEADDGRWHLTGAGRLVADAVARCGAVGEVVATDAEYWATHDATGLPERFRRDVDRLAGCEVVRSPDTDPYRAARRSERAIREAESVAIVAPVYSDRHAEALLEADAAEARLILTPQLLERMLRDGPDGPEGDASHVPMRVQPADVSLTVTDRELLFSLPDGDGSFDATTEVVADTPQAIRWGRRLFEHYWADATPFGEWLQREHPETAAELERARESEDCPAPDSGGRVGVDGRGSGSAAESTAEDATGDPGEDA